MNAIALAYQKRIARLDHTRRRMERLFSKRRVTLTDISSVYEALFLKAVTLLESFLEELFFAVLHGKCSLGSHRARPCVHAPTRKKQMTTIIFGRDKYLDWIPYQKTLDRAKLYLVKGRPFSNLPDQLKSDIKQISLIRHAIAHRSAHSQSEFRNTLIGNAPLRAREKTPSGFLRSRITSANNRFQVYMGKIVDIISSLAPC